MCPLAPLWPHVTSKGRGGAESVVRTHISQSGLCGPLESAAMMDGVVVTSGAVGGCFLDAGRRLRKSLFFLKRATKFGTLCYGSPT